MHSYESIYILSIEHLACSLWKKTFPNRSVMLGLDPRMTVERERTSRRRPLTNP
jgi:hypothetical protein